MPGHSWRTLIATLSYAPSRPTNAATLNGLYLIGSKHRHGNKSSEIGSASVAGKQSSNFPLLGPYFLKKKSSKIIKWLKDCIRIGEQSTAVSQKRITNKQKKKQDQYCIRNEKNKSQTFQSGKDRLICAFQGPSLTLEIRHKEDS
jgi:hypothetical protein